MGQRQSAIPHQIKLSSGRVFGQNRPMATYIYETIPKDAKTRPRRFEVQQKMSEPALKRDPDTGLPVRRVIVGGSGIVSHGASILSMNVKRSK
jgi:hypothetical protein